MLQGTPVIVKFDKDYAYGEKEDAFKEFAGKVGAGSSDVIVATVAVQEYGDKINEVTRSSCASLRSITVGAGSCRQILGAEGAVSTLQTLCSRWAGDSSGFQR